MISLDLIAFYKDTRYILYYLIHRGFLPKTNIVNRATVFLTGKQLSPWEPFPVNVRIA